MKRRKRKAQEEMVGFVLIVVLVAVIALIFLAISARKPAETQENKEIENFLHASLLFTTDCKPSPDIVYDFKDLIRACLKNERCVPDYIEIEGEMACSVLNQTAFNLLEASWQIGENSREKAYVFKIYKGEEILVYLRRGEQTSTRQGSEVYLPVERENIYMKMELFY